VFDSQADIAAVVYGSGDDPDGLLSAFADDLRRSGHRAAGLIQAGRRRANEADALSAIALPTGAAVSLRHGWMSPLVGCRLDPRTLAEPKAWLAAAIEEGADLVIINRFGRLEMTGVGFVEEIRQAVDADIPVLIAVPQQLFMAWTRFCCGMAVKLSCSRGPLEAWWRTVARAPREHPPGPGVTFCELAK